MTALPRNQYSTTFSLDGLASPASPHRGRQMPHTFKPTPLRAFTVVVSAVPADQLRQHSTAPSTPGFIACALDGAAGVAGVGGPPAMAGSVPASGAMSMSNNFLANASFGPASSSFAFTKSFGDVFTRKKAAGTTAAPSDRMNGSFGSQAGLAASASAAAAAAAAVQGLSDPTVSSTPLPNSLDSYRVHLLLPPTPVTTEENSASASATAAAAGAASRSGSATCRGGDETDGLSAATSSLDALRTPKRRQAAQVSEHWLLFQQLVRFVLSVAPRFEPPATPPGFAFPVDLGLSFVQNSSMFAAAEATQLGRGGNSSYPVRQSTGLSSSFFASPTVPPTAAAEDPLVSGDEREARRNYMEAYLNAALQCDQVNCLKELQSFVGYDTYLKNELAHFRAMSHTSSSSSIVGSPATGLAHHGSVGRLNGSRADFTTRGPLGSSSQSTSSRSQCTVSTASSVSPKGGSGAARETALLSAPALATASASAGVPVNVPSSRGSELSPPQLGSSFSASPPALARSVPYPATDGDVHGVPHVRGGVGEANSLNSTASGRQEHTAARFLRHDGGSGAAFSPSSSGSHHPPVLSASSLARQPRGTSTRTSLLLGAVEVEDGSSRHSSQSAGSSFGSSVSHPGSGRRRRRRHVPHHHHRTPSDPASKKEGRRGDVSGDDSGDGSNTEADAFRRGERRGGNGVAGHEEERAAAPPPLPPPASAAGLGAPTRADLRSLVSMAPETERMLTECFRMMDTTGCGYVSAGDCVLFYLCATPDTFVEALYYYSHAVGGETGRSTAGEAAQDAAASSSSTEQLEALLPTWMQECESVVVGNPHYLMSCARFVDAVREILAVSAGAQLISTPAVATASTTAAADGERASTATRSHSKTQTSVSGDAASRNGTPASSLASPSGLPTVLVGSVPSRDGRRGGAEGTPLQAHSSAEQQGRSTSPPSGASPTVAAPVASLEAWIDNYWLLLYSHLFAAVAAVVVGEEAAVLRAALFSIRERAYVEMAAQVATTATAAPARHASPLAVTCPPWVLREVSTALATQPPILGCFNALELMSLVYVMTESGIAVVGLEDVLQWLGTRNCAASTRFSLDDFASLLDVLSCSLPFTDVLRCLRHAHHPPTEAGTTAQQQQERVSAHDASLPGSAPPALLLRLVSRCATADPTSGHEFNELVRDQRWRRSDTGAAVGGGAGGSERGCAQCALTRGVMEQQAVLLENLSTENAALQQRIAALEAAVTTQMSGSGGDSSSNGKATTLSAERTPAVAPQSVEEAAATTAVGSSPQPTATSPSAATATAATAVATAAPHRTTLELIPVFTAEHHDSTHSDALNSRHHSSRQPRAAVTQVARAGPLLYTVPARYARRQPSELEVSFYLCRAGLRTSEAKAAAVERLTLRDASGHRVLACKLSGSVLHILGRATAPPRTTRLSLVTEPLSPTMGRWSAAAAAAAATASSPHRSRHRHGVAGRAPNILFPCYDDSDGGESGEAASLRLDSPARLPRSASDCDPSLGGVARLEHIASARASLEADAEPQRRVARVVLQSHVWYTLKLRMNWAQHTVEVAVVTTSTSDAAADAAQSEPFSSGDTNGRIFEDTFGMLDAANAAGLTSLDVLPRREMLVAYCNVLMRYDAPDK